MDNFATWMINGGRDPMEVPSERDLFHRRALRDARGAAGAGEPTSVFGRLAASVRSTFRTGTTIPSDAACCAA